MEIGAPELERERHEVELDAMRLMTRTQRFTMLRLNQAREQIDRLHAERELGRTRLNRTLGRRLLRLTRRLVGRPRKRPAPDDAAAATAEEPPRD